MGNYQYKVVLVMPGASVFRGNNLDNVLDSLKSVKLPVPDNSRYSYASANIRTKEDLDYAFKLYGCLSKITDYTVRVESPWISVYTNSRKNIDAIINVDNTRVKYYSVPPINASLNDKTIIMPKIDYDYRITMGKTSQNYGAFVGWAESNSKVKLTKSCIRDLTRDKSWGGTYFYVSGDNTLLMAKMHLGGAINKIERIVKA